MNDILLVITLILGCVPIWAMVTISRWAARTNR